MEPRFYLEPWYVAGGQGLACDSLTCFFSSCFRSGFQNRLVRALLLAKFSLFLAGKPSDEAHKTVFLLLDFCVAALLLAPFYFCAKPFAMWWPDGAAHVPLTHVCMHWWSESLLWVHFSLFCRICLLTLQQVLEKDTVWNYQWTIWYTSSRKT